MREAVWEKQSGGGGGGGGERRLLIFGARQGKETETGKGEHIAPLTAAAGWGVEIRHRQSKQNRASLGKNGQDWPAVDPPSPSPRLGLLGVLAAWGGTGGPCVPLWSPRLFTLAPMRQGDRGVARRARPLWCGTRGNFSVGEREWARDPPLAAITHGEAWRWAARSERTGGGRFLIRGQADIQTRHWDDDEHIFIKDTILSLQSSKHRCWIPNHFPLRPNLPIPGSGTIAFSRDPNAGLGTLCEVGERPNYSYSVSPSTASVGMSSRFQATRLNTGRTFHSSRPVHAMHPLNFRQEEQHTNTNAHNSGFHIHDIAICLIRPPPQPNEP